MLTLEALSGWLILSPCRTESYNHAWHVGLQQCISYSPLEIREQTHRRKSSFSFSHAGLRQAPSCMPASSWKEESQHNNSSHPPPFLKTDVESLSKEKHKLPCEFLQRFHISSSPQAELQLHQVLLHQNLSNFSSPTYQSRVL